MYLCYYFDVFSAVNGGFSNWLQWTDCSVSCGSTGQSFRVRSCDSPKPSNGGSPCHGATLEFKQCTNGPCVGMLYTTFIV